MEYVQLLGALSLSVLPVQQGITDEQDARQCVVSMERKKLGRNNIDCQNISKKDSIEKFSFFNITQWLQ